MQKKVLIYFYSIKMSEKILTFDNIKVKKKISCLEASN